MIGPYPLPLTARNRAPQWSSSVFNTSYRSSVTTDFANKSTVQQDTGSGRVDGNGLIDRVTLLSSSSQQAVSTSSYLPQSLQHLLTLLPTQRPDDQLDSQSVEAEQYTWFQQDKDNKYKDCCPTKSQDISLNALQGRLDKLYQIRRVALAPTYSANHDLQIASTISQKINALENQLMGIKNEPVEFCVIVDEDQYHLCQSSSN